MGVRYQAGVCERKACTDHTWGYRRARQSHGCVRYSKITRTTMTQKLCQGVI